jgi:hypothetical protein
MTRTPPPPAPPPPPPADATPLTRRNLMKVAGVGTAVATVGTSAPAGAAGGVPGLDPTDISFEVVDRFRPLSLLADGFLTLRDGFGRRARAEYDVVAPEDNAGRVSRKKGRLRIGRPGGRHFTLLKSDTGQDAPFTSVVVTIARFSGDIGEDKVFAGLIHNRSNWVLAWYDRAIGMAGIDVSVGGFVQTLGTGDAGILTPPCRLAFSLTGTTVVVSVNDGSDDSAFVPIVQARLDDIVDLRTPDALAAYRNGLGARSRTGRTELASVRGGYFGQLGLRDPHVVTYADGRPYLEDDKAYVTFTQAGLGSADTAHWGVWTVDLDTYQLTQVGNLFFTRDRLGVVLGDHAGHLVRDEANDRWILATSTWGDVGDHSVAVYHRTLPLSTDVLHGGHVLRTRPLPLPLDQLQSDHVGQWGPHLVKIRRRWYVAFVNARTSSTSFPALARTRRGAEFTDLHLVGADYDKVDTSGTVLQKVGDHWWLLASNGDGSPAADQGQYPVYDLHLEQVGALDARHPTGVPWPMMFPVATRRGRVRWVLLTSDGKQFVERLLGQGTHGDVIVMEGDRRTADPF